jgi:tRNA-uridine 2-sulfurtransferase
VVQGLDHPLLMSIGLRTEAPHWILGVPQPGETLMARIRHRQPLQAARITDLRPERLDVAFEQPQRAVAPGQSIVFYRGDECLGGAVIADRNGLSGNAVPV